MKLPIFIVIDHDSSNELSVFTDQSKIDAEFVKAASDDEGNCTTIIKVEDLGSLTGIQVRKAIVENEAEDDGEEFVISDWELVK